MAEYFDAEILISLVEERPLLWDRTDLEYNDKAARALAWKEICTQLCPEFDSLEEVEKDLYGRTLQSKWKGLRDSFSREMRRLKNPTPGVKTPKRPYIYYNRMLFLEPCFAANETTDSKVKDTADNDSDSPSVSQVGGEEETGRATETPHLKTRMRKKMSITDVDLQIPEPSESNEQSLLTVSDDEQLFCLSLQKELLKIPAEIRISTKIEIMKVLEKAQLKFSRSSAVRSSNAQTSYDYFPKRVKTPKASFERSPRSATGNPLNSMNSSSPVSNDSD